MLVMVGFESIKKKEEKMMKIYDLWGIHLACFKLPFFPEAWWIQCLSFLDLTLKEVDNWNQSKGICMQQADPVHKATVALLPCP